MTKRKITMEQLIKRIDRQEEVIAQLIKIVASTNNQMTKMTKIIKQNSQFNETNIIN